MAKRPSNHLMAVFAHPDDETLASATLARWVRAGGDVTLVCTTNGGGGNASEGMTAAQICAIRQQELRDACSALGVDSIEFVEDLIPGPAHLSKANHAEVVGKHLGWLVTLMNERRPDAIITFGAEGVTGHPAHIMVGLMATQAALAAECSPDIYYVALAPDQIGDLDAWMDAHTDTMSDYAASVEQRPNIGPPRPLWIPAPAQFINLRVPVGEFADSKRRAWQCHKSQGGEELLELFSVIRHECFVHVCPPNRTSISDGPIERLVHVEEARSAQR